MAVTKNDADYMSAPKDYAAVFEQYYWYVVNLVSQFGIDDNNKEDVACEVLLRFMERGSLEKFDPELAFEYRGSMRPARFKNFLSRHVDLYTRGQRDKLKKQKHREVQICDVNFHDNGTKTNSGNGGRSATSGDDPWVEVYGTANEDHADRILDTMTEQSEADTVRQLLALVPARNSHDQCDLVALYDAVRAQVLAFGEYDISILKDRFNVASTTMHTWVWWLKANLAHIYGVPVPAKRARRTKPKEA